MDQTIVTPRGTISIQTTFDSEQEAVENGYGYWFTHHSNGKRLDIYSKALDKYGYRNNFAVVQRK